MIRQELGDTLVALVEGLTPEADSGLVITHAELDVPLEVTGGIENGRLVFFGNVPHSRWNAGFLPPVHMSRLVVSLLDEDVQDS